MKRWGVGFAVLGLVGVPMHSFQIPCQALTLTGVSTTSFPLTWDTFPTHFAMLGIKEDSAFLNPNDEQLQYELAAPGIYDFDIRLNKGIGRNMLTHDFALYFDGSLSPGISATADVDADGGTPPFSGSLHYLDITLTDLRISTFNAVDEVGEHSAGSDGNIDYVGSFQLTVVPEPATLALLTMGTIALLAYARRRRRGR